MFLCVDGGRLRQRKNKRGRRAKGAKHCGFHTDWIEPKRFTIYLIDEQGDIIKKGPPFVDGTTGKLKAFLQLLRHYLTRLGVEDAREVVIVGDGAPWIWERIPNLLKQTGVDSQKITEIIDWTHAKQNLNKAFETLSKNKIKKIDFNHFKDLLFSGKITKLVDEVKSLLKVRVTSKVMKKLKSYFVSNENRKPNAICYKQGEKLANRLWCHRKCHTSSNKYEGKSTWVILEIGFCRNGDISESSIVIWQMGESCRQLDQAINQGFSDNRYDNIYY